MDARAAFDGAVESARGVAAIRLRTGAAREASAPIKTIVAISALALLAIAAPTVTSEPHVRVEGGVVGGVASGTVVAYKGIPYAAPPVGERRWRPPAAVIPWSGIRRADDYGASCMQAVVPRNVEPASRAATLSEDCLTLNVWTPAVHANALPVMVWLHGGANAIGTGSQTFYDGASFARDGVIAVTLNYRLGLLGFFAHKALTDEAGRADIGNFGLLDQIAALRWVRANIAAFGGDPGNVTLFGESAGGEDSLALATSAAATNLFQRAIVESANGIWDSWPTVAEASARGARVATTLGLAGDRATAEQLRGLPAGKLVAIDESLGPIVDGHIVAAPLLAALARGTRVPLLIGTNDGDGSVIGAADVTSVFPQLSAKDLAFMRARYRARGTTDDAALNHTLFGDAIFAAPARWAATQTAAAGHAAYLYRFDYIAAVLASRRSAATHGSEIPFVFETFPAQYLSDTDRNVEAALHECWIAFARNGVPLCARAPGWSTYDAQSGREMIFDATPSLRDPGDADVMDVLQRDLKP